jgi:predicted metal-dependent HD superfamily phosphohydrolase
MAIPRRGLRCRGPPAPRPPTPTLARVEEELRAWWTLDLGAGAAAQDAFDRLLARYREPHRRYHTARHVLAVLREITALLPAVPVSDAASVRLAGFFHDAIYRPASDDEAASAALARRELGALGVAPDRVDAVAHLVLATADHHPQGVDEQVLCDADLAVLAAPPATYEAYARGVRAEYGHVDDDAWRVGRGAVLEGFLNQPQIFATPPMRGREPRARANLEAELARLSAPG